ncbi:MAG: outer membrane protein assembly factor BamA [Acidobacteriia bacterium]|nr:outer membrane protein assembly factor BamA [Terriglobia bacterium]
MLGLLFLLTGTSVSQQQLIEGIRIHGNRRIPAETMRARIFTREGDVYDEAALQRDFASLWNTGYFEDLRIEREDSAKGYIIHFYVKEKPTIREINYQGLNSVSQSDVLDRFKERKVGLTVENQYDPTKIKRAEVVLKELLSEHGRQFATIRPEVRPIPPAAVAVTFIVNEGPKVKVGKISFEGNNTVSGRYLRDAMKNLKPIGIPHSIILENVFSRTYDATKLQEDTERVRDAYQQKGFFKALVQDPKTQIRDTAPGFPWLFRKGGGKAVDITIPVEEGARFRLAAITFKNNKAVTSVALLRRLFPMKDGELFNTTMVRKGLKNLRDAYGELGYINFTAVPDTKIDDEKHLITLDIDVDEGKPFYVRRIEFQGNTTTRDKVIRRELALEEGNVYNSKYWELSLLRLNQLNYFEPLKPDQDSDIKQNNQESTVDITLKVKEKGKNSIGLTGGVSGLAGSFVGLNYQTNNFLGLGETLTVDFNIGSYQRNLTFGFTEPYAFDRPLQLGFTVFSTKYEYNQAQQVSLASGQQVNLPQNVLDTLQDYSQSSTGFTASASYALRRSFKRIGITYSIDRTSVTTFSTASQQLFENLAFRGFSGPNALEGVITSKVIPSFSFSTIDSPMHPTRGRSVYLATEIAGLGGNVRDIRPVVEFKRWTPMKGIKPNSDGHQTLGFRVQGSFITGFGGLVAPPFQRMYLGGDNDLRGFDIRTVGPYGFIVQNFNVNLTNPDGTAVLRDPSNPRLGAVTVPVPIYSIVIPGGDTSVISNVEYRMPIAGPVTLAAFMDFGMNMILRNSQLRVSDQTLTALNTTAFGCPSLDVTFSCAGGTLLGPFAPDLKIVSGSNYVPRMSTGLEFQVLMPVVNAPMRVYYAWNPLILNSIATPPFLITRAMFPPGGAGDFTFQQLQQQASGFKLVEPRHTFRFSVATTF